VVVYEITNNGFDGCLEDRLINRFSTSLSRFSMRFVIPNLIEDVVQNPFCRL